MYEIKCPCGLRNHMDEEDCKKTNCNDCCPLTKPQTNADLIRRMTDEELAEKLFQFNNLECSIPFCKNLKECDTLLDTDDGIPEEKCRQCLLEWLKQPADTQNSINGGNNNEKRKCTSRP